jgi:hypothetical protein
MRRAWSADGPHEPRMEVVLDALSRLSMIGGDRRIGAGLCITATESTQIVSIKYAERLAEAGIEPSFGNIRR